MLEDLIRKNRSCRRFYQNQSIAADTLEDLVNLARLSASAGNFQPLKYILSCRPQTNKGIFDCLVWAGYLKDWPGPREGERPSAYIIILADTTISENIGCDHGIAAQSILLGARELGFAGCILGSVDRDKLHALLNVNPAYKILLVLALGKPKEDIMIENVGPEGDIKYWRDENDIHHVPKRNLNDIIVSTLE